MLKFYSLKELINANLAIGDTAFLDIKPHIYGNFKICEPKPQICNGFSVLDLGDRSAVRFYEKHNSWMEKYPSGNLISHKGFNGWCDLETLSHKPTVNGTYSGNTYESILHAIRLGYKIVEFDITVTKDDEWIVSHDHSTHFQEPEGRLMRELPFEEINALPIYRNWKGGGFWEFSEHLTLENVPLLDDVLALCAKHDIFVYLDAKWVRDYTYSDTAMDKLAELIKKHKMERRTAAYAACFNPLIRRIPEITAAFINIPCENEQDAALLLSSFENYLIDVATVQQDSVTEFCKKYNVPLTVWLSDDYREVDEIFAKGADYVMTNFCLYNPDLSDYNVIYSYNIGDFVNNGNAAGEVKLSLTLSFEGLDLHPGDMIVLSADSEIGDSGEAYLRIATETAPVVRYADTELTKNNNSRELCYVVNDKFPYDITVTLGAKGCSVTFDNVMLKIMRETARGER